MKRIGEVTKQHCIINKISTKMRILGIGHNLWISSACLIDDGKIVGALAEERINRQKGFQGFPMKAINKILTKNNLRMKDIDLICVG